MFIFESLKKLFINPLKQKYGKELVFVVNDDDLVESGLDNEDIEEYVNWRGHFMLRYKAEVNPTYRQVIPYCVLIYNDKVFMTKRISGSGEARLVGKHSIGVGGHINPVDLSCSCCSIIVNAINREIEEEVYMNSKIVSIELADIISLNTTEVDSVHLGLVYIISLDGMDVTIRETNVLEGEWIDINSLVIFNDKLENWSKFVLNNVLSREEFQI